MRASDPFTASLVRAIDTIFGEVFGVFPVPLFLEIFGEEVFDCSWIYLSAAFWGHLGWVG